MSLYHACPGRRSRSDGKFRARAATGTQKRHGGVLGGWSFDFHEYQTGASIKRTLCSASIRDPYGNRVEYLRGYKNVAEASAAARKWIETALAKLQPGGVINQAIPSAPQPLQEK